MFILNSVFAISSGLHNKDIPSGLNKQNDVPDRWSRGKKAGLENDNIKYQHHKKVHHEL
jgi:hypothetical protein